MIIPGILPSAANKQTRNITAFAIHGIGRTSACFADPILDMFSGERFRTRPVDDDLCDPRGVSVIAMPVCLATSYGVTGEAFVELGPDDEPRVIGKECGNASGASDILVGVRPGAVSDSPLRVARMGTLFRYSTEVTYVDGDGLSYNLDATTYAYWWHGDANAIQAPFVGKDQSPERTQERVIANRELKRIVMNEGLVDAAFFLGSGGALLREGTQSALCRMVLDVEGVVPASELVRDPCQRLTSVRDFTNLKRSQVVLLTQSLGSRILFDSMSGFRSDRPASNLAAEIEARSIGDSILESGPLVYMSANQLPLLGVADVQITDPRDSFRDRSLAVGEEPGFQEELEQRAVVQTPSQVITAQGMVPVPEPLPQAEPAKVGAGKAPQQVSLVSFYDPNDLLGYPAGDHLPEERQRLYIDVQQRYAIPWFFFANPAAAHDKSFNRNRARRMILCGAQQEADNRLTLRMNADCRAPR